MNEVLICQDCGGDCEWYMVYHSVWAESGMSTYGYLCFADLEKRLGRKLTAADFPDYDMNAAWINAFA